ncbi:hypothetical protein XENORESO_021698 [Xenotaenia resolanae]|uniref:Uncharacterized protein n=1 Tax=Xenotaenia resolanae TaxID=208358 RepID=A0ABV0W5Q2_9TELE
MKALQEFGGDLYGRDYSWSLSFKNHHTHRHIQDVGSECPKPKVNTAMFQEAVELHASLKLYGDADFIFKAEVIPVSCAFSSIVFSSTEFSINRLGNSELL